MNRVAVRDYELILWGFEATPSIFYFELFKHLKTIIYLIMFCIDFIDFPGSRGSNIVEHILRSLAGVIPRTKVWE